MALYDYHCQACGHDFEEIQSIKGRDLVSCPDCGARTTRKMSTFQFKMRNPFTKDGEGFKAVGMSKDEYDHRIRERSLNALREG